MNNFFHISNRHLCQYNTIDFMATFIVGKRLLLTSVKSRGRDKIEQIIIQRI